MTTRRRLLQAPLAAAALSSFGSSSALARPARFELDDPVAASFDHPERLESDRERDATRLPKRVLDFFDLKRGQVVADLMAGDGYYTELMSRAVGEGGRVYCQNTRIPLQVFADEPLTARLADERLPNVERRDTEFEAVGIPEGLDMALLVRFYHDFGWQGVDRAQFNALVYRLLKPGGVFGVVDHIAAAGKGIEEGRRLHRVEPALVQSELEEAGFVLEAESYVLRDPADTLDWNIFSADEAGMRRDRTSRFVHLYRKPA